MDELACLLMNSAKNIKQKLTRQLKTYNITCRQALVLRTLDNSFLSAKKIGEICLIDKATLSSILDKLILHNYVVSDFNPQDKRENIYTITQSGLDILPKIAKIEKAFTDTILDVISEDEYKDLITLLSKINSIK